MAPGEASTKRYICPKCRHVHPRWAPRCAQCTEFGLVALTSSAQLRAPEPVAPEPLRIVPPPSESPDLTGVPMPIAMTDVPEETYERNTTGVATVDRLLDGGIIPGQFIVLYGEAGSGKSSLIAQIMYGLQARCFYATGEETIAQATARARRIDAYSNKMFIDNQSDLDVILKQAQVVRAEVLVTDSINVLTCKNSNGQPGSIAQVRECAKRLMDFAKHTETSVIAIGHVTNDGQLAGPQTLKHLVDTVMHLSNGTRCEKRERILRTGKHRFGLSFQTGYLELTKDGFIEMAEPSIEEEASDARDYLGEDYS